MAYPKLFNHTTGEIEDAPWVGRDEAKERCEYCTASVYLHGVTKVTYQCRLTPDFDVQGHKACWRHRRMFEQGKKIALFPPKR